MTKRIKATLAATALAGFLGLVGTVVAAVPDGIDYQGYLTNSDGSAVDGDVTITFVAYNVEIGGAPLWSHSQTVPVELGLFSLTLGTPLNPFPTGLFDGPVYVGLTVAGEELLPRRNLNSAAYSFKASDADTLQGQGPAVFDQSAHVSDTGNPHGVTAAQTGALVAADLAVHTADSSAHHVKYNDSDAVAAIQAADGPGSNIDADSVDGIDGSIILAMQAQIAALEASNLALQAQLSAIAANSVLALDGVLSKPDATTMLVSGVNLQINNGSGNTYDSANGVGNLIVGYNTENTLDIFVCSIGQYDTAVDCDANGGTWWLSHKSGSHNVVIGDEHNYSSEGGLLAGVANTVNGQASSVTGGTRNVAWNSSSVTGGMFNLASGQGSVVASGRSNVASGTNSSVSGGASNEAQGFQSSVSGGKLNVAAALDSSVAGGESNTASGIASFVGGGTDNEAGNFHASVSGGESNRATGRFSSVLGGRLNTASGQNSSISGGLSNGSAGTYGTINGGRENATTGLYTTVSGGEFNSAIGQSSVVSGGNGNEAGSVATSVSGGRGNMATAVYASVSGGEFNSANGQSSAVSGGNSNEANNVAASVSGGFDNTASGSSASVGGGQNNLASGGASVVSGGRNRTAAGPDDWVAGSLFETQ